MEPHLQNNYRWNRGHRNEGGIFVLCQGICRQTRTVHAVPTGSGILEAGQVKFQIYLVLTCNYDYDCYC